MSIAAIAAALILGLFAATAMSWYDEVPKEETPTETTPTQTVPTETTPVPEAPPPPVAEALPLVATEAVPAAPAPAPAELPPVTAPQESVKGEIGSRNEDEAGGAAPTVIAQAEDVGGSAPAESTGQLAETGLNLLVLALLGGSALAGSALLFRRARAN